MLTAYSRVTVVTAERKVDLALPSALPVGDVVPQVLRYCAPDSAADQPISWTLARVGGQTLALTQTLSDAGVMDGDVLELRAQQNDVRPAIVEDVRDAVEDSADAAGGAWSPRTTITFVLLAGAGVFTALAGVTALRPELLGSNAVAELVSALAATVLLLAATAWATYFVYGWVAQVCTAVAMVWGSLAGVFIGDRAGLDEPAVLILAVVLVTLVAGGARLITPAAMGHLATAVILLIAGLTVAIFELSAISTDQILRIMPVAGLLAAGVIPRLSLSVGGLASADYRVRNVGQMSLEGLRARYRQSNAILVGGLIGISAVVLGSSFVLTFSDEPWDRYLALSLGVAIVLRSRVYSRTQHMAPFRVVGTVILGLQVVRLAGDVDRLDEWLILVFLVAVVIGVGTSTLQMSEITRARMKRLLNAVEFLVIIDLVVLLCGATGVFAKLGNLV